MNYKLLYDSHHNQQVYYSLKDVMDVFVNMGISRQCVFEAMKDILPILIEAGRQNVPTRFSISFSKTDDGNFILIPSVQVKEKDKKIAA